MTTALLLFLLLTDVGLIVAVMRLGRRQDTSVGLIEELTEERRMLAELRAQVHEELQAAQAKAREALDRATRLATEAEHEVKTGASTITREVEAVAESLTARFREPLAELARRQAYVDAMTRRFEQEKTTLTRLLARGEKICRFFDARVPYQEVLEEIEDKKYSDARSLLARGQTPAAVAVELGMSEAEVRLVAGFVAR